MNKKTLVNLGCGKKLFENTETETWINVDIVRPETIPEHINFVTSDVCFLKDFDDNSVNTIFCSHVLEHLKYHNVPKALKEWLRVLKPDGTLILEMPDLIKCCINVLQFKTLGSCMMSEQLGIYGLYGEQDENTPYMQHYWAWTFDTLKPVVEQCGYVDVIETIPVTHMRTQRDFRLEAKKPMLLKADNNTLEDL